MPVKILFLAANPLDSEPLRLDEEIRAIDFAIRQSEYRDQLNIQSYWATRTSDLHELLLREKPDIVHFSGHGSNASEIILHNDQGNAVAVSAQALGDLFRILKDDLQCVVLNACCSANQAKEIAKYIKCVVGISEAISDVAAIEFSAAFYRALGYGQSVHVAFELGCNQIHLNNFGEADKPRLVGTADPTQVYFTESVETSETSQKELNQVKITGGTVYGLIQENKGNMTLNFGM